jgi:predicted nucleic acid-binding protein
VIFVDTSFFFPLLSAYDRDHERVRAVFEGLRGRRLRARIPASGHGVTIGACRMTCEVTS